MSNLISVHASKLFSQEKLKTWDEAAEYSTARTAHLPIYCWQENMIMIAEISFYMNKFGSTVKSMLANL